MSHWRYHAAISGTITIGDGTEQVNDYQIMEIFSLP
jgi:hypothetical protein